MWEPSGQRLKPVESWELSGLLLERAGSACRCQARSSVSPSSLTCGTTGSPHLQPGASRVEGGVAALQKRGVRSFAGLFAIFVLGGRNSAVLTLTG